MTGKEAAPPETAPDHTEPTTATNNAADDCDFSSQDRQGEQDDIRSYLHAVFGHDTGFAVFALGMNPRRNPTTGKYEHEYWSERNGEKITFAWPEEAEQICEAIEQFGHLGDLYVVPYLRRTKARAKGDAVILRLLHTDGDKGLDPDKIATLTELGAFVVGSGTPGNGHVYVPLSESVSQTEHEALCKGFVEYLDGDKAKRNDNDLLRPVGAYNHKPTVFAGKSPTQVRWWIKPNGSRVDPRKLAEILNVDLDAAEKATTNGQTKSKAKSKTNSGGQGNGQSDPRVPVDIARDPKVQKAFLKFTGDRSADIARVVGACMDSGLTKAQTRWVVEQRTDLAGKLDELGHDDVDVLWDKLDDDRRTKAQSKTIDDTGDNRHKLALDDARLGEVIVRQALGGKFARTGGLGWMHYDGQRWKRVDEAIVYEHVRRAVKEIHRIEANKARDREPPDVQRLREVAGLLYASRISALLRIAKGMLTDEDEQFDAHPDLLNVANGVLDVRTGELSAHDPALKLTKVCPTDYRADAVHPDWDKALTALPDRTAEWAQIRLGQALTGHAPPDDLIVFPRGGGANGKSTIVDAVLGSVGGDYAVVVPERVLLANPGDHPTELMTLRGARLALMEELPELGHLNIKRVKNLAGGQTITARAIGKDNVSWVASHALFVTTNYYPKVDESDHGTWRRLAMLEFPYRFRKSGQPIETVNDRPGDPGLRQRLRHPDAPRAQAVLAWLVAGAMKWYANGKVMPELPEAVIDSTGQWRRQVDQLARYLDDNIIFDSPRHVMAIEMFGDFINWLKDHGHRGWSEGSFVSRMEQHELCLAAGIKRTRVRATRGGVDRKSVAGFTGPLPERYWAWLGLRFRTAADGDDGR
jgi:putative DNA primase/helicase